MSQEQINGDDLLALGYTPSVSLGIALKINKKRNGFTKSEMLAHYKAVLAQPATYLDHPIFKKLSIALIEEANNKDLIISLNSTPVPYHVYGKEGIEAGAIQQMEVAVRLPVAVAGALMPDAHQGYGLPIGGVLATHNAIIPYGVGVDIGCRMALSIYDIPASHLLLHQDIYEKALLKATRFGAGHGFLKHERQDHAVLDNSVFDTNSFVKSLKDKAWTQLGTSGGGNHFVEFGIIEFKETDTILGIEKGAYVALLTHSGSRGMGATIAGHYTQLAKSICKLPYEAQNLAYLDMDSEAGIEYWLAMNLAGDYAAACHQVIHEKLATDLGATVLTKVENHHNFAWKEIWNGTEVIVHRKGATPASEGVMGIIPGSMTAPGFLVRGKGAIDAIQSASHGAGRLMSRTKAIKNIAKDDFKSNLEIHEVTLIGGGLDEAPMAYKDIHAVMAAQEDLVSVVASFQPKLVRMAADGSRED